MPVSDENMERLGNVCTAGNLDALTTILEELQASNDMRSYRWALIEAVNSGHESVAIRLIQHGVPFSPDLAVTAGRRKMYGIVLAAMDQGWDINTQCSWADPPALR